MRQKFPDGVAGNREADPDVALLSGVGVDGGVDAYHFAAEVEQRSAGVPRIDRCVGLQHLSRSPLGNGERTLERADDADAHRVRQTERVANRHDPVARLHLRRVSEFDLRQCVVRLLRQFNQGAIGQRIAADDLRVVLLVVIFAVERHLDLVGPFDDVIVREDESRFVDDEAGPGGLNDLFTRPCPSSSATRLLLAEEAIEQVASAEELAEVLCALP